MRESLARKRLRQQALLRIVATRKIATQTELAGALRVAGFDATQATVSRDIVEVGLVKVAQAGRHIYATPAAVSGDDGRAQLRRLCEDYPVEASIAGDVVVLRSQPATANAIAAAIDGAGFDEVLGTIAGDDTVFAAVGGRRAAEALVAKLAEYGVHGPTKARSSRRDR